MFEHLDDPAPPTPDAGRYQAVLRRSRALRAQARRRTATSAVVVVLGAGLVATTWLTVQGTARPIAARETAYQFNEEANPLPAGAPVPSSALTDVVFVGPQDGYGLADHRNELVLAATGDGGTSWDVVDGNLPAGFSAVGGTAQMEFTSTADGYLWRGPVAGSAGSPMWTTGDGGTTWEKAPVGPVVDDVSAIGDNAWALVRSCPPTGPGCTLAVEVSTDAGASWQRAPAAVPADAGGPSDVGVVELARVTTARAYVFSEVAGTAVLAFTDDAGTSWTTRAVPCAAPFDTGAELALSSTDDLWLICGGQAAGGSQAKALYRSSTGGATWSLAAQTAPFAGSATPPTGVGSLPLSGYVAPYSLGHKNLAVLTPTTAWLFPTRGVVSATTDGGTSWTAVPSLADADFGSGAPGNVTFISATQGWVVEFGVGLWRTTDATTWRAVGT
jgi:hypothetical protein